MEYPDYHPATHGSFQMRYFSFGESKYTAIATLDEEWWVFPGILKFAGNRDEYKVERINPHLPVRWEDIPSMLALAVL